MRGDDAGEELAMFGDARTLLYVVAILVVLGLLLVQPADVIMALHMAFGP
jgi:hypothetical protein